LVVRIAKYMLHYGEEPALGDKSGAVFFSGCTLKCVYCQNYDLSHKGMGENISIERLADIFRELEAGGADNIDLVTGGHFAERIMKALDIYRPSIPIVWNNSGYESVDMLKKLEPYVDIYLPDIKYADPALAENFSGHGDYPEVAFAAVAEMLRQKGSPEFDENGRMKKGVLIRHLVLPLHIKNTKAVLETIADRFGVDTYVSVLLQYTPVVNVPDYPELNRHLTERECDKALKILSDLGMTNGYIQELSSADKSWVPDFYSASSITMPES